MIDFYKLSDQAFSELSGRFETERRRRTKALAYDPAAIIIDNEMAKRALTVAIAGQHSILFIGPPASGKSMLRALALELGHTAAYESRPCPCGNHGDVRASCTCTVARLRKWKLPKAAITTWTSPPTAKALLGKMPGTTAADIRTALEAYRPIESMDLDDCGRSLLRAAINELDIDAETVEHIREVARTIAGLDRADRILNQHLCEAINYRPAQVSA